MEKRETRKLIILYSLVFALALYADISREKLKENGIERNEIGEDTVDIDLLLDVEGVLEDYPVSIEVEPMQLTADEAEKYFSETIKQIEEDFEIIERVVPIKNFYREKLVKAEWSFSPAGYIGLNGEIATEKMTEEGVFLTATVQLLAGRYEKIYVFPFRLEKPRLSLKEIIQQELDVYINQQQNLEGEKWFQLPGELGGYAVKWGEKKEYLSIKILALEIISFVILIFARKRELEEVEKKKKRDKEREYPRLIHQLLILLEAGMTTRQAWRRIAYQYTEKRKKMLVEETEVYNTILQMDRQFAEGETERIVYETFMNQMEVMCYRRLMRLLIHNLEKGNKDICMQISLEAKTAYEQRLLLAKRLGEEASTKMLVPMMLMMVIVMTIVIAPAIIGMKL